MSVIKGEVGVVCKYVKGEANFTEWWWGIEQGHPEMSKLPKQRQLCGTRWSCFQNRLFKESFSVTAILLSLSHIRAAARKCKTFRRALKFPKYTQGQLGVLTLKRKPGRHCLKPILLTCLSTWGTVPSTVWPKLQLWYIHVLLTQW